MRIPFLSGRTVLRHAVWVLALATLQPLAAYAQTENGLQRGDLVRLKVTHQYGVMNVSGAFSAARSDSVILQRSEQRFAVASSTVRSAYISRGPRKNAALRYAVIGGTITGLILGIAVGSDPKLGGAGGLAIGFAVGFPAGALVGGIVGISLPTEKWRRIPLSDLYGR